jgi:predicted adenine nucleotide alpha hydrolase (AANH) superfamily ATPase
LSQRQTVFVFYILSATFGLSGLFLQSRGKLLVLLILFIAMVFLVIGFSFLDRRRARPKLLLHTCCAPCVAYVASQVLARDYEITLFFSNSNIDTLAEWEKRLEAVKTIAAKFHFSLLVDPYERSSWQQKIAGYETAPEGGSRCVICFRERLTKTAELAKAKRFDCFATSLTSSPYKDSQLILALGEGIGQKVGIKFVAKDFKDNDGSRQSLELAKKLGIYRQKYCGCEFAKKS